jgi:hypothetical protein
MAAANAKLANPLDANAPAPAAGGPITPANAPAPEAAPVAAGAAVPPRDAGPMPGSHIQLTPEMMLQMYNRDRAEQGFYRGLALMSAGAYPGRNPGANALMIPQSQDPESLMRNIAALQTYQADQEKRQAAWDMLPKFAEDSGITLDQAKQMWLADPDIIGKVAAQQAGFGTGPQAMQRQAVNAYRAQYGKDAPLPSYLTGPAAQFPQAIKDVEAEQNSFNTKLQPMLDAHQLATDLSTGPDAAALKSAFTGYKHTAAIAFLNDPEGKNGLYTQAWAATLNSDEKTALAKLLRLNGLKTSLAVEAGGGRRAASVTNAMSKALTNTGVYTQDPDSMAKAVSQVLDLTNTGIATLYGVSGNFDSMPPEFEKFVPANLKPGQLGYRGGRLPSERGEKPEEAAAPETAKPTLRYNPKTGKVEPI